MFFFAPFTCHCFSMRYLRSVRSSDIRTPLFFKFASIQYLTFESTQTKFCNNSPTFTSLRTYSVATIHVITFYVNFHYCTFVYIHQFFHPLFKAQTFYHFITFSATREINDSSKSDFIIISFVIFLMAPNLLLVSGMFINAS